MAIPKKIHFCWLSKEPFPEEVQRCIDSWHNIMPDYEIKLWNTDVFDTDSLAYTSEAMAHKKYAFVSDVIRLYAIYSEGGIYLDSDIEVYKPFDELLKNRAFTGFESGYRVGPWLIAGEKGNHVIKKLLDQYNDKHFIDKTGNMDMTPNTVHVTALLSEYGLKPSKTVQELGDITVYPEEYFCPKNPWTGSINITPNTYAMHLFAGGWNDKASDEMRFINEINDNIRKFLKWRKDNNIKTPVIIYGTGVVGLRCHEALCNAGEGQLVKGFMVTHRDNSWTEIDGVEIKETAGSLPEERTYTILVGTNPRSHEAIGKTLKDNGFNNIYFLGQ